MDASHSQRLSIESFSYSWLINLKPSFDSLDDDSLDASDEASFIEMDPKMPPSKQFYTSSQNFNFEFPIASRHPVALVHADEMFSDGLVVPFFVPDTSIPSPTSTASSSTAPKMVLSARELRCSSLRRCRRLSKQVFHKYLDFLITPLFRRAKPTMAKANDTRTRDGKNWVSSLKPSPRTSAASACDWRRSCDSESSLIHEAVLHCKRSIGNLENENRPAIV